jgi:hypothetical protein
VLWGSRRKFGTSAVVPPGWQAQQNVGLCERCYHARRDREKSPPGGTSYAAVGKITEKSRSETQVPDPKATVKSVWSARPRGLSVLVALVAIAVGLAGVAAATPRAAERTEATRVMSGTRGIVSPVDPEGLSGRVLCGYQGWFAAEGDGAGIGWRHWKRGNPSENQLTIDLLPDVSEIKPENRFPLGVKDADGNAVEVFSSYREATVRLHFQWMREYGIDGVFVQRFAEPLGNPREKAFHDTVLQHCRNAAKTEGRVYAVMYDLSGMEVGTVKNVLDDWRELRDTGVGADRASLRIGGRPLVAIWGVGFAKDRDYSLKECRDLVTALRDEGCSLLLGVPTGWRTGNRDASPDPLLREIVASADAISPWTVGRYRTLAEVGYHAEATWEADLAWCEQRSVEYLPVVFPGFSWKNLKGGPLNQVPRLRGTFFQRQINEAIRLGSRSLYVAMFDECDEGTAIFKCAEPPRGLKDRFVGLEGLPSDHYLKITGAAQRRLQVKEKFRSK